jgi:hypothetical protein
VCLQNNGQKYQVITVRKQQTNLTSLSKLASDALTKGSSSFDDWNFDDDEGIKEAKKVEDGSLPSLDSTKTTFALISAPQGRKKSNQTTIRQCYPYHVQSNNINCLHNAEPSTKKTANQLGLVDPLFSAKVRSYYVDEYQHQKKGATKTNVASQRDIDSTEETKEGGLPPPQRWTERSNKYNLDREKKRSKKTEDISDKEKQDQFKSDAITKVKVEEE